MEKVSKFCKCGCDQEVLKGNDYVHGHNRRGLASCTTKGRWAINYDKCIECKTVDIPHGGKGLCKKCYKKYFYGLPKNRWSKKYDKCIDCGRTDRPHHANGRCGTCHSNNLNRLKGKKKRNFGAWSWYYDKCKDCGTIKKPHVKDGLCYDCYEESKRDFSAGSEKCPVCGIKVLKLNQHLTMKSKKCDKHREYQYKLFKQYFDSDLGLEDISKEVGVERHAITHQFRRFFGKEETEKRNQKVKSCLCSENAKINFNQNNRFGSVVYYDSLNNGKVRLRSKLELKYAKKLDSLGIDWLYEERSFPYIDKSGKRRTYTPDFYILGEDRYIEVKGYDKGDTDYKINKLKEIGIDIKVWKGDNNGSL